MIHSEEVQEPHQVMVAQEDMVAVIAAMVAEAAAATVVEVVMVTVEVLPQATVAVLHLEEVPLEGNQGQVDLKMTIEQFSLETLVSMQLKLMLETYSVGTVQIQSGSECYKTQMASSRELLS